MYPHERSLVKKMEGKPFALLGVNSDIDKDELKKAMEKEKITWRSWWEGSQQGPISTKWNVTGWPSIFVIDAKGVIRYKQVQGDDLDQAVNTLLKEAGVEVDEIREKEKSQAKK
jgi:hypothetical protein